MSYTPKRPSGTSDLAQLLGWMWDRIQALEISDSQTIKVTRTPRHTVLDVKPSADVTATNLSMKGEYILDSSYNVNDIVRVSSGLYAGTYCCIVSTSERPWNSTSWIQLSSSTPGVWI